MRLQTVSSNGSGVGGELNALHKSDLVIEKLDFGNEMERENTFFWIICQA